METPVLIVNCKTYPEGSGDDAKHLAYTCEKVAETTEKNIAIAVQNADIGRIADRVDIPVLAQHTDPEGFGSNTGSDIVETLLFNGAEGTLINHSEDQVSLDIIESVIDRCTDNKFETVVCVDDVSLADNVAEFKPDYIAYEPEELIGGDTSVSEARAEVLEEVIDSVGRKPPVLAGAGIKTREDVSKAIELGAEGVLVASGVVKADNPREVLERLVQPL